MALTIIKYMTVLVASALAALMLYAGEPDQLWWWPFALPFGGWIIGPAVVPYLLARWLRARRGFAEAMLVFLSVSSASAASVYHHAFFVSTSSTAALAMIFVPLWQWVGLMFVAMVSGVALAWLERRRSRN